MGEKRSRIFRGGHTYSCSQTGTAKLACCSVVQRFAVVGYAAAPTSGLDCLMFPQARPSKTDIPLQRCQMRHPLCDCWRRWDEICCLLFRTGGEFLKIITTCKSLNEIDKQTFLERRVTVCECVCVCVQQWYDSLQDRDLGYSNVCITCLSYCVILNDLFS